MKENCKLNTICYEMDGNKLEILRFAETNLTDRGKLRTHENNTVIYSGKDERHGYSNGVAVILSKESAKSLIWYNPIYDRILKVRIRAKPYSISLIQFYALTVAASDEEMEDFYNMLQEAIDSTQNQCTAIVIGDFNAKIGKLNNNSDIYSIHGLEGQNERGANCFEFCSVNNLAVANTLFNITQDISTPRCHLIRKHAVKVITL